MAPPKLIHAHPNGQTAVVAIFDQRMRGLGPSAPEDPVNPFNWTPGLGLPAIKSVARLSAVEFEISFVSPAPLGAGYTIAVADTVQSMLGQVIDPAFRLQTFDIVTPDLVVDSLVWISPLELDVVFSETLATILFDEFKDVVSVDNVDLRARQFHVIGLALSGNTMRLTFEEPGTAGARYVVNLNRTIFQSLATGVTLRIGEDLQQIYGQGFWPSIAALNATETSLQVTASEILGDIGWPSQIGAYSIDKGNLGSVTAPGDPASILTFPSARFTLGDTVNFQVARALRDIHTDSSIIDQATTVVGAGTDQDGGAGAWVLNKLSGAPFELTFSAGIDTLSRTGRRFGSTFQFIFTPSTDVYPLAVVTFLNTQVSVLITKTANNLATLKLYRGAKVITGDSLPFDPTVPFELTIIDATAETDGFFAAAVGDIIILGGLAKDLNDPLLLNTSMGVTAFALTLGGPATPTQTFQLKISVLGVQGYYTTGLLGRDSFDLLSFPDSIAAAVVTASAIPLPTGGYANTGNPAFGVHAEYDNAQDRVQVYIGLNQEAVPLAFTGSVTLLTGDQQPMDQVLFDQSNMLVAADEPAVPVIFMHPKLWNGVLASVAITIGGVVYTTVAPVIMFGDPPVTALLTQQPASWYQPRVPPQVASTGAETFGPAAITGQT